MTRPLILIVDDHPENLTIIGELLQPTYAVRAANSGERALHLAEMLPQPDLVLLDVMMPGMDGYEVLARLRESAATAAIPVIFLTALNSSEDEERGLLLGAMDYITKPIRPPILMARVRTQIALKQARALMRERNRWLEAEVARRLHTHPPVLPMTANAFGDDRQACLDAGMDDHLAKLVKPELLNRMMARWLAVRRARTAGSDRLAQSGAAASLQPVFLSHPPAGAQTTLQVLALASLQTPLQPQLQSPLLTPLQPPLQAPQQAPGLSGGLAGIPGLTVSSALLYLPGRDQIFARVLRQFVDGYSPGFATLGQALALGTAKGTGQAQALLHALRGACGVIGATELSAQALALELALGPTAQPAADPAALQASAQALQSALAQLVQAIRSRLAELELPGAAAPAPAPSPSPAGLAPASPELDRAVQTLRVLLASADFGAGAQFRLTKPVLRAGLGAAALRLIELPLHAHDYGAALEALDRLCPPLGSVPAAPH